MDVHTFAIPCLQLEFIDTRWIPVISLSESNSILAGTFHYCWGSESAHVFLLSVLTFCTTTESQTMTLEWSLEWELLFIALVLEI